MKNDMVKNKIRHLYQTQRKGVAWLIDPDKMKSQSEFKLQVREAVELNLDFFFIGGSLIQQNTISEIIRLIKSVTETIPVVIFPGNVIQFSEDADGILFLSLISGRNPELLIGQHVTIAPLLKASTLEVLPTGYLLIDGGQFTSVNYISQSLPLPNNKPDLSVATALAGYFLGLQYFYLDAGSGASTPVSSDIIRAVKKQVPAPLLVGGGLDNLEKVKNAFNAGADLVVLGNGTEKNPGLLAEVLDYIKVMDLSLNIN